MNPFEVCVKIGQRRKALLSAVFLSLALCGGAASAKTVFEQVFETGTLNNAKMGDKFVYSQTVSDPKENTKDEQSSLVILVKTDSELAVTLESAKGNSVLGTYPKKVGNPVQMYFLEKVISLMAKNTGGSEYYIRNRVKEALGSAPLVKGECLDQKGAKLEGECLIIKPFEHDKMRDKMADFADLQLYFSFDHKIPAYFTGLHAKNPGKTDGFSFGLDLVK